MRKQLKERELGIKQLKDQASGVVDSVERTGRPVVITRNGRRVARIVPIEEQDPWTLLRDAGLIASEPQYSWRELKLETPGVDSRPAIDAILEDRVGRG